ncbi:xanthine dehydrogenase family protein molybdopterin-binding subunit [Enhydrobacter sp.]|jgi:xanthine dehydrogenase YagR molybdenum-binding subunit|uniref:xanthine dehydrogenase family protein molybdopterin-binding subunit n=1 Tax=Enhydrobacter sp. TaxID=1894999 RepID=UPI002608EE27|nr:xanthine dehydrogenase family protein molybdopterin-binding subunit [Enhydrobacter sp.]WIM10398.1 MAG: Periplasmic aromatic aldehyde oxidoreductase, molybdenum binding subunit YagR [Enhydrobacter sp.]
MPDSIIGQPIDRIDGPAKVTGRALYAADVAASAPPAYGVLVTSTVGRGEISKVEAGDAESAAGVLLVMSHENAPPQAPFKSGGLGGPRHARPKPQLDGTRVHYYGEPVALVVAETFEQATAAARLVRMSYRAESGSYDLADGRRLAYTPEHIVVGKPDSRIGDVDGALATSPVTLDATYTTPYQSHNPMELVASLAEWSGDKVTIHCATQLVNSAHRSIAATLKLPLEKVEVVSEYVGGGFGGKLPIYGDAILAALAAKRLGRPVKIVLTRQQMFSVTTHRGATIQRVRLAAAEDGKLSAVAHEVWAQSARLDEFAEAAAASTRAMYAAPNRLTTHRVVPLDLPVSDSMRAPGDAAGQLALEQAMDELAEKLGLDPIEFRLRNEPDQDPEKHVPFSTRSLVLCLKKGAEQFGWSRRDRLPGRTKDGDWLIGLGMATAIRPNYREPAHARVRTDARRHVTVEMDMTDIGTGSYTILAQVAADVLQVPIDAVSVHLGHSTYPQTPGSGGSFGAASSTAALRAACLALKEKLDAGQGPGNLQAEGQSVPGEEYEKFSQYSYGAHFAEVAVDITTGEVRLRRMLGVFDAGRILNAKTARSQLIGGMLWGVGSALHENAVVDTRSGAFVNHDLAGYHVPVHADVPAAVDAVMLSGFDDKSSPLGCKGVGELGICGAGAAIANAVYNACGVRVRDYPITPDKILSGLLQENVARRR